MSVAPSSFVGPDPASPGAPSLRRALGRWDLAAIGINQTIGGAVFLMPSQIAAAVGAWSPFAILGGTLVTMIVGVSLVRHGRVRRRLGRPCSRDSAGLRQPSCPAVKRTALRWALVRRSACATSIAGSGRWTPRSGAKGVSRPCQGSSRVARRAVSR